MAALAGLVLQALPSTKRGIDMRTTSWVLLGLLLAAIFYARAGSESNGFDLTDALIPADQIHLGGPPRDGIPSIDKPVFVAAGMADFLSENDRVLGLNHNGEVRAYPIAILNWHEVVNDRIGGDSVAVTYCPLCGTGVAFDAADGAGTRTFGVSGLLYNSDVLLYDRETESLWSQLMMQAVSGPQRGASLAALPLQHTSWRAWRAQHPDTKVLSTDTGFARDYSRSPYDGYASSARLYFSVQAQSRRYHPKEQVLGVEIDGQHKAYPFTELDRVGVKTVDDMLAGKPVRIVFDARNRSAKALDRDGRPLPAVTSFWFAWYAFHPDGDVFVAPR